MGSLDVVATVLLDKMVAGEDEKTISTPLLSLAVSREYPQDVGKKPFVCQGGSMSVPKYDVLFSGQNGSSDCPIQRKVLLSMQYPVFLKNI